MKTYQCLAPDMMDHVSLQERRSSDSIALEIMCEGREEYVCKRYLYCCRSAAVDNGRSRRRVKLLMELALQNVSTCRLNIVDQSHLTTTVD